MSNSGGCAEDVGVHAGVSVGVGRGSSEGRLSGGAMRLRENGVQALPEAGGRGVSAAGAETVVRDMYGRTTLTSKSETAAPPMPST